MKITPLPMINSLAIDKNKSAPKHKNEEYLLSKVHSEKLMLLNKIK
jgi:hypothetical protein